MTDYNDDEEAKKRQSYEDRIAMTVFLIAFLTLGGIALLYTSDVFPKGDGISLPDINIETPFSPIPMAAIPDPAVNPYHEEGLPEATAAGVVTDIVPRDDRMPDGTVQKNYYARTEYYLPKEKMDCYFHHYLGPKLPVPYARGQSVTVSFQPQAADACGSSRIFE